MLASYMRRAEKDAGIEEEEAGCMMLASKEDALGGCLRQGGGRSTTLAPRRRMECDAGTEDDNRVRHWCRRGQQSTTLALRRWRMEEDAGVEEEESGRGCWH